MNDREELQTALAKVGRLTLAQAVSLTGGSPPATGRRLEWLVNEGLALKSKRAYWHPACPRRGAAHRQLVADIYVALVRLPSFVGWNPPGTGSIRPDAWIRWRHESSLITLALEADRGTETLGQWSQKLAMYEKTDTSAVLVAVVPGRTRAGHLHRLLEDTLGANTFIVSTVETVATALTSWTPHNVPKLSGAARPSLPPDAEAEKPVRSSRAHHFMLKGRWVVPSEDLSRFPTDLKALGRERRAGYDIIHLDRRHR